MDHGSSRSPAKAKALKLAGAIVLIAAIPVGLVNPFLAIIPCFVGYLLLRQGKKHAVKIGDSVLKDDARPPVLYLRSFKDESLDSSILRRFKGVAYSDKTWLAATVPNNSIQEQDALGYVFRKIGPYIALGKPGEELPELGSSKLYTSNDEWQNSIRAFFEIQACHLQGRFNRKSEMGVGRDCADCKSAKGAHDFATQSRGLSRFH
jgi:hypothetical protein